MLQIWIHFGKLWEIYRLNTYKLLYILQRILPDAHLKTMFCELIYLLFHLMNISLNINSPKAISLNGYFFVSSVQKLNTDRFSKGTQKNSAKILFDFPT